MKIFGVLHPLRAAMPHLQRSDGARLVIINAVLARRPETAMIAVGTARAALLNMTRALATELAPVGVLVNLVGLRLIDSRLHEVRYRREQPDAAYGPWFDSVARERAYHWGAPVDPKRWRP